MKFWMASVAALALAGSGTPVQAQPAAAVSASPSAADEQFRQLGERYIAALTALNPVTATQLG